MNLPPLTLILGGARSGKSTRAEALVLDHCKSETPTLRAVYIATAQAFDQEMEERIALHQQRRGAVWETIEEPLALANILARLSSEAPVLIDCLTLWMSNLLLAEKDIETEQQAFLDALDKAPGPVVCVSNEVGLGIVPDNPLARRFRDASGRLNQAVAAKAQRVEFLAAGLPLVLKGG